MLKTRDIFALYICDRSNNAMSAHLQSEGTEIHLKKKIRNGKEE